MIITPPRPARATIKPYYFCYFFVMALARILIVDDESMNLDMIQAFLSGEDYALTLFQDSLAAWAHLEDPSHQYDLILLDRIMPGLDGIEFIARIKANPRLASLPVIMQTAANTPDQVAEGLAAGAYYYLTKPYEPPALLSIVRAAVSETHHHQELQKTISYQHLALGMLKEAYFVFHTMQDVPILASLIAQLSAQPDTAVIGLSELLCNAVEHGNLGISYSEKSSLKLNNTWDNEILLRQQLPENAHKKVRVRITYEAALLHVQISDEGPGFDWRPYLEMSPERAFDPNGRGIALSKLISFTDLQYQGKGNVVSAYLPAKPSSVMG